MSNQRKTEQLTPPAKSKKLDDFSAFSPMQNIELKIQEAGIESEVGIFESYTLLLSMLGLLEVGFIPATVFVYILMTVAFAEMMKLQENRAKEEKI